MPQPIAVSAVIYKVLSGIKIACKEDKKLIETLQKHNLMKCDQPQKSQVHKPMQL